MTPAARVARNGTLILGGGFAGANLARLLGRRGATIVSPESSMLYTPLLPEIAAGAIEPRHAFVPLRMMCPDTEHVRGRAVTLDEAGKTVLVETADGPLLLQYERLVVALGSTAHMPAIPGLNEHAIPFKNLSDATRLRNHVLRCLDAADLNPAHAEQHLTFVFAGAGYAGVEALAELMQLTHDVARYYPGLRNVRQRWVLVDTGMRILKQVPGPLGDYATTQLRKRGVEIRLSTGVESVEEHAVTLSDGTRIETETFVWTAGVVPHPLVAQLGLPRDERGRIVVDSSLRVDSRTDVWALGDCARVPNGATPEHPDPPTCQHALRQARRLANVLRGSTTPYRYRSIGEGATLGRDRGIARMFGMCLRGLPAALIVRAYHLKQVPVRSRRLRILTDGLLSRIFRRDMAELGMIEGVPAWSQTSSQAVQASPVGSSSGSEHTIATDVLRRG